MDVGAYMVLMVPGKNVVWPDSLRFADMRLNAQNVTSETLVVDGREHLSAVGGWMTRWRHIHQRGTLANPTEGFFNMPWVRCREEADYQKRFTAMVHDFVAQGRVPDLSLDLVGFDRLFDSHWIIARHRHWIIARHLHFYLDLDTETRLR